MNLHRITLCLGLLLTSFLSACQTSPRPTFRTVPVYPSAQRVDNMLDTEWSRTATFRTPDSRQAVQAYYKDTLPQQGWIFEGESHGNLGFYYPDTDRHQPLIIHLRILIGHDGQTDFMLKQLIAYKGQLLSISP
jgi:hypothetical protein